MKNSLARLGPSVGMVVALIVAASPALAESIFVSPDVPSDPDGAFLFPWEIVENNPSGTPYSTALSVPGQSEIDAIQKLDAAGAWLFSVEAPTDLAGSLSGESEGRDVLRYDGAGLYSFFFCGAQVAGIVPASSNIDALYLDGGDKGDLIVSFDVPTTIGTSTFSPTALVRYTRTAPGCAGWTLVGQELDPAGVAGVVPVGANVIAADHRAGETLLAFDTPADLSPSTGPATYLSGQIASFDGTSFALFQDLSVSGSPGWSLGTLIDALSCQANPGRVRATIMVNKSALNPADLTVAWAPSCSSGAEDYGIYEGNLDTVSTYDHIAIDCVDDGGDLTEEVTPSSGNQYYLVVANNGAAEGSYGLAQLPGSGFTELPQAAAPGNRCRVDQVITACP